MARRCTQHHLRRVMVETPPRAGPSPPHGPARFLFPSRPTPASAPLRPPRARRAPVTAGSDVVRPAQSACRPRCRPPGQVPGTRPESRQVERPVAPRPAADHRVRGLVDETTYVHFGERPGVSAVCSLMQEQTSPYSALPCWTPTSGHPSSPWAGCPDRCRNHVGARTSLGAPRDTPWRSHARPGVGFAPGDRHTDRAPRTAIRTGIALGRACPIRTEGLTIT